MKIFAIVLPVSVGIVWFSYVLAHAQTPSFLTPEIQMRFQLGQALQAEATAEAKLAQVNESVRQMGAAAQAKADWWARYLKGLHR